MPNESSMEVLHNASTALSGFSLSPSLDPSTATKNYNHNFNTESLFTYSLNSLLTLNSGEAVGSTHRGTTRQPRQLNSPVPTSHNVPLSWSAISPAPQIPQGTDSSVPSSLPLVGQNSPSRIPDENPIPSPQTENGTVGASDTNVTFGHQLEPSSRIKDLQFQASHDPNTEPGYQQLEPSHAVFIHAITFKSLVVLIF